MRKDRYFWPTTDEAASTDDRGLNSFLSCLFGSVFILPGLAVLINRWLPDGCVMQWVLVFYSALAFANLVHNELNDYNKSELS